MPRRLRLPLAFAAFACSGLLAEPPDPSALQVKLFAREPMVQNPVALTVDEHNRVYVTSVVRRQAADLDIRRFTEWIETDLSLTSIAEKRAFLLRELTPENSAKYAGRFEDSNGDGSFDWRDLDVLSDRISRLGDRDGDGIADHFIAFQAAKPTEVTGIAAGIVAWDGTLYAAVEPDLVRLDDPDGDGIPQQRTVLAHGFSHHFGYGGHNFSGAIMGPDGRLYASVADRGVNVTTPDGVRHYNPHSGAIVRVEPDGSHFEIFATGLRNLQEPAFDAWGNLLGVDNDGDMTGERERFVYVPEGSDAGWRTHWQYRGTHYQPWMAEGLSIPAHPGQPAYLLPPVQNHEDGPAGFAFNPGTALSPAYRDYFFLSAFPSRILYAFRAEPDGAGFRMVNDHIAARGVLMVGLGFGADGKLYVADWSSDGYAMNEEGAVWTLDDPAHTDSPLRRETAALLVADWPAQSAADLTRHLGHADQRVRMKAQFELARRDDSAALIAVARDSAADRLARAHAIWGLGQLLRRGLAVPTVDLTALLQDSDAELRAQTARIVGEARPAAPALLDALLPLLDDVADRPRFFAALALGRQHHSAATPALLRYLARDGADPYHRHAIVMGLAGCASAEALAALTSAATTPERLGAVVALRRQRSPLVAAFLADADPAVVAEAAGAIHDDESIPAALPALAAWLDSPDSAKAWERTIRRALSAALRLREPEQAARVAAFAARPEAPVEVQLHALSLLRTWPAPANLDSVEGAYRPLTPRDPADLAAAVAPALRGLAKHANPDLARAAWEAAAAYQLEPDTADLIAIVDRDTPLAADALRALQAAHADGLADVARRAANSRHEPVRVAALLALAEAEPAAGLAAAATLALGTGVTEARAALTLLTGRSEPVAVTAVRHAAQRLRDGGLDPALALDVLEAAANANDEATQAAIAAYQNAKDAADPLAPFIETLQGGDIARGRTLFETSVVAQCTLCHRVSGAGSNVGPPMARIGERSPRHLLEALVNPGAVVAPGYGLTEVTLVDGTTVAGTLLEETETVTRLRLADGEERELSRGHIQTRTPELSSMPPMGLLLPRTELRDLLAYLQYLKGRAR